MIDVLGSRSDPMTVSAFAKSLPYVLTGGQARLQRRPAPDQVAQRRPSRPISTEVGLPAVSALMTGGSAAQSASRKRRSSMNLNRCSDGVR